MPSLRVPAPGVIGEQLGFVMQHFAGRGIDDRLGVLALPIHRPRQPRPNSSAPVKGRFIDELGNLFRLRFAKSNAAHAGL